MDVNLTWKRTHIPSLNWHVVCNYRRPRPPYAPAIIMCVRHNNETKKKPTNKMCTQLFNMKHTQHKQGTHTHMDTHTHTLAYRRPTEAACVVAKWLVARSGPVDRRIAAVPSRVPARPQRIRARARSTCAHRTPPVPSLTLQMYLSVCVSISAVCIFALSPLCRRVEVNLNGRRLIPDLFLSASSFRLLFLNSLYDPLFFYCF